MDHASHVADIKITFMSDTGPQPTAIFWLMPQPMGLCNVITTTGTHGLNRESLFSDPADDAGAGAEHRSRQAGSRPGAAGPQDEATAEPEDALEADQRPEATVTPLRRPGTRPSED